MFSAIGSKLVAPATSAFRASVQRLSTATPLSQIYKIQSQEDFVEKVKNSKTPVVVDFFAT